MSGQTVIVTNAFFTEIGLLIRSDSGRFSPNQTAKEYQRSYQWSPDEAGLKLAPALEDQWFARALIPRLKMRSVKKSDAVTCLAEVCKASPEYRPRLEMLLEFLDVAGIIKVEGDEVKLGKRSDVDGSGGNGGGSGDGGDKGEPPEPPELPPKSGSIIPADAPFIFIDPERKRKVTLIMQDAQVTQAQYTRIENWFKLQFFVTDADGK